MKKGLRQKVEEGGTVGLAPIGYVNVRRLHTASRASTGAIDIDQDRAVHIRWAFEQYALGTWSVTQIVDALAARGLVSRPTRRRPGAPLGVSAMHHLLTNPYYKGVVTLNGAEHAGSHQTLVSVELWDRVQRLLVLHRCGERTRAHNHYLKSTIFCYACGRRLIMQHVTSHTGKRYAYFACSGRQAKPANCRQRAIPVAEAERRIEELHTLLNVTATRRHQIENELLELHQATNPDPSAQLVELEEHLRDLEERQLKLLDAYYVGALPRELFLDQQRELTRRRTQTAQTRDRLNASSDDVRQQISQRLDILEDCAHRYATSDPAGKKDENRTQFQKVYLGREADETKVILTQEFGHMLDLPTLRPDEHYSKFRKIPGQDQVLRLQ